LLWARRVAIIYVLLEGWAMEYRKLGNSEIAVSVQGFGCWAMGGVGWGPVDDRESIAAVQRARDLGVNFFDTADAYGFGHSEEVLAKALGKDRSGLVVATKGGLAWDDRGRIRHNCRPEYLQQALEASLRRLKVDCIDLYQIHWPDPEVPVEDTIGWAFDQVAAGKIQAVGVSNYNVEQLQRALAVGPIASLQPPYSLIDRRIEKEILPFCREVGLGVVCYSPLEMGILTGKFGPDTKFTGWRATNAKFQGQRYLANLRVVERMKPIAAKRGITVGQLALAWVVAQEGVTSAIVGAKRPSQVDENVGAAGVELSPEDQAELDRIVEEELGELAREE
jgi:aryl-alcohol dehydrogenase-like predicted oxidoreductase